MFLLFLTYGTRWPISVSECDIMQSLFLSVIVYITVNTYLVDNHSYYVLLLFCIIVEKHESKVSMLK